MKHSKLLSLLLAVCLVIGMVPAAVFAEASPSLQPQEEKNFELDLSGTLSLTDADRMQIASRAEELQIPVFSPEATDRSAFGDFMEAVGYLREQMTQRKTQVVVPCNVGSGLTSELANTIANYLVYGALDHTGVGNEGDYLLWHLSQLGVSDASYDGSVFTLTYSFSYYTTAAQERAVLSKAEEVLSSMKLEGKTAYQQFDVIYDYVTHNVEYDYDNLGNADYTLKYSAYAALIDGKAVCQGYANLLYLMLLEAGVDCRIITGIGDNGQSSGRHAWNIAGLYGLYYNVDSTWDAAIHYTRDEYYPMNYRLKCNANFTDHTRDDAYLSDEFEEAYPMSERDFDPETDEIDYGFKIVAPDGSVSYEEYVDSAVSDAPDGSTIYFLKDAAGWGFSFWDDKALNVDMQGHSYTLNSYSYVYVGKGSVSICGGTIIGSGATPLVENSAVLELKDMTLDGTGCSSDVIRNYGQLSMDTVSVPAGDGFLYNQGQAELSSVSSEGSVELYSGSITVGEGCELGYVYVRSGEFHVEGGMVEEIDVETGSSFTVTKTGDSIVGIIPEGYEWKEEEDAEVLSTIYEPVTVYDIGAYVEYDNWTEKDRFHIALMDTEEGILDNRYATEKAPYVYFNPVTYILPGTYEYLMQQKLDGQGNPNIDYDMGTYPVTVTVTKSKSGVLHAEVRYDEDDSLAFFNFYTGEKYEPVTVDDIQLELEYNRWEDGDSFEFCLSGNGIYNYAYARNEDHRAVFPEITYYEAGEYEYRIVQDTGRPKENVSYDEAVHTVLVSVTGGEDGKLHASVSYDGQDSLTVVNTYTGPDYTPVTVTLQVTKEYNNWQEGDVFAFELGDWEIAYADYENRTASFNPITYRVPGDHYYTIYEYVTGADPEISYDTQQYEVTVEVSASGNDLLASVSYRDPRGGDPMDSLTITNVYDPSNPVDYPWMIDGKGYDSLQWALKNAKDGDVIELTRDFSGYGLVATEDAVDAKDMNITIDLGGHSFTLNDFMGLIYFGRDCKVLIENGTIKASESFYGPLLAPYMCTVTLQNVTLDGTNLSSTYASAVHAANGSVVNLLEGVRVIGNPRIYTVFVSDDSGVFIDGAQIDGTVYAAGGVFWMESGEVNGEITAAGGEIDIISGEVLGIGLAQNCPYSTVLREKEGAYVGYIPAGYMWAEKFDQEMLVKIEYAAAVYGEDYEAEYYMSLAEAVANTGNDQVATLLIDTDEAGFTLGSGKQTDVDLNGHIYGIVEGCIKVPSGTALWLSGGEIVEYVDDASIRSSGQLALERVALRDILLYSGGSVLLMSSDVYGIEIDPSYPGRVNIRRTKDTTVGSIPEGYEWKDMGDFEDLVRIDTGELIVYNYAKNQPSYSVEGQTVTVSCSSPCRIGYLGEDDRYVKIAPVDNGDGSYSFEAPEGVREVILVLVGDTDLNGKVTNADATKLKSALKGTIVLEREQEFSADVNGDGQVKNSDATKIKAVLKGTSSFVW